MRAAIFRGGDIVVDTMPAPVPGVGQVLVKTLACGICGSDLHAAKHAHRMVAVARRTGRVPMDLSRDIVFGHEFCCGVLDYSEDRRSLKPGTRVCAMPLMIEADGPKGMGYSNTYVGGYAEQMLLSAPLMLEVPNGLPTEHAALTEPLAVGVHAVEKGALTGDEAPLVVGCGPVGLAVIAALRLKGVRPIVAADFSPNGASSPSRWAPMSWSIRRRNRPMPNWRPTGARRSSNALAFRACFSRCSRRRRAMRGSSSPVSAWSPTRSSRCSPFSRN
jgi:threonine dehydrogenase-like Zn-dependent dehydrogenase